MDTSGIGNVVFGYYSLVIPKWGAHRIGDVFQWVKERRFDYLDDRSQIDWGREIGHEGDYTHPSIVRRMIPSDFVNSR
jgi:hypothetical protein